MSKDNRVELTEAEIEFFSNVHPDNVLYLSDEDFERFMDMLNNPPEPNENLKKLAVRFNSQKTK